MAKAPAHTIRYGLIKVSIWKNQTRSGDRYSISVVRLFRNGDRWTESHRFGRDDLLLVAKACDEAHSWIYHNASNSLAPSATPSSGDE